MDRTSRSCRCRICEPSGTELDQQEQRVVDGVTTYGWWVTHIFPEGGVPGWSFTSGLTHSFGWPELIVTGLSRPVMDGALNMFGELARGGRTPELDAPMPDVLEGHDVVLRQVHSYWHHALVGWSQWFAQHGEPDFVQVVWPDRNGWLPWEAEFDTRVGHLQPDLTVMPSEHAAGAWRAWAADSAWPGRKQTNGLVFASRSVVEAGVPVLGVCADLDGSWSFVDGAVIESSDQIVLTHLHHLIMADPTLDSQIALPPGWSAWRSGVGEPWNVVEDSD